MLPHIFPSRCKGNFLPVDGHIYLLAALLMFASRKMLLRIICLHWALELNFFPLQRETTKAGQEFFFFFLASLNSQISDSRACSCQRIGYHHLGHYKSSPFKWGLEDYIPAHFWFITENNTSQNWTSRDKVCILALHPWATHLSSLNFFFSICAMWTGIETCQTTGQVWWQSEMMQMRGLFRLSGISPLHFPFRVWRPEQSP